MALNPDYDYVLAGLVIFVFALLFVILFTKRCLTRRRAAKEGRDPGGFAMEPWGPDPARSRYEHNVTTSAGEPHGVAPELTTMDARSYASYQGRNRKMELGPQQTTQEYI